MVFVLITAIFVLGFINRAFHLFRHPWVGVDTFRHLWLAREIGNTGRLPRMLWGYPHVQPNNLPPFADVFLAVWPEKLHRRLQYLAPGLDVVSGLIILAASVPAFGLETAAVATAFYFLTPIARDNHYLLGSRAFGNTLLVATLFPLFIYYQTSWPPVLIIASVFAALVILTDRLALQSLAAVLTGLTIGLGSPAPLAVLLMGLAMAFVFTKGYLVRTLKGHFEFVAFIARRIGDPGTRAVLPGVFPNPLLYLFNAPLLALVPFVFSHGGTIEVDFFLVWTLSVVVLTVLWVFGEGYRHLAHAAPAFSILAAAYFVNNQAHWALAGFLAVCAAFTAVKIYRVEREKTAFVSEDLVGAFRYVKEQCRPADVVLCLPLGMSPACFYFSGRRVLWSGGAEGMVFNRTVLHRKVKDNRIDELVGEYGIKWIVAADGREIPGKTVFSAGEAKVNRV
ncbi:MAG: hypothetical protein HY673_20130 [Chloroflexi bacterium]|nr:hypothetical protein [Chloroflexota bacterium]